MIDLEKLAKELIEKDAYMTTPDEGSGGYEDVEDGVYNVKIERAELRTSEAGNKRLNFMLRHENNRVSFVDWYMTEKTIERTLKRCMTLVKELGYEISAEMFAIDNLEATMQGLIGENAVYTKKTNGDFVNHSIHGN